MKREIPKDVEMWVAGKCYIAALELHRATGWEMGGLTATRNEMRGPQMAHAWVIDPEGTMWDAAGVIPPGYIDWYFLENEKQHTKDSARHERFPDEAAFIDRHRVLAGDWWEECRDWFRKMESSGIELVRQVLIPRYPALAEAAARHATAQDPFVPAPQGERQNQFEMS